MARSRRVSPSSGDGAPVVELPLSRTMWVEGSFDAADSAGVDEAFVIESMAGCSVDVVSRHRHCVMCGLDVADGEERVLIRRVAPGPVAFGMELAICVLCWGTGMSRILVAGAQKVLRERKE